MRGTVPTTATATMPMAAAAAMVPTTEAAATAAVAVGVATKAAVAARVPHGYGNTRGVSKTGNMGTGTVVDFGTPRHTAYPYPRLRYFTGILQQGEHNFYCFETQFSRF